MTFSIEKYDIYKMFDGHSLNQFLNEVESDICASQPNSKRRLEQFDKGVNKKWYHKYVELRACWGLAKEWPELRFKLSKKDYPDIFIDDCAFQVVRVIDGLEIKSLAQELENNIAVGGFRHGPLIRGSRKYPESNRSPLPPKDAPQLTLRKLKDAFNKKNEIQKQHPKETNLLMHILFEEAVHLPSQAELEEIFRESNFNQIVICDQSKVHYASRGR